MALTAPPRHAGAQHLRPARTAPQPAGACAAWAASGAFGDEYAVYEREGRFTFAAGVRARIILTRSAIRTECGETSSEKPWSGDPAADLAEALAALPLAQWRVYGWVGFDFCAPYHGLLDQVGDDEVLAHLFVPEFEAHACQSAQGELRIDTGGADAEQAMALLELATQAVEASAPQPVSVDEDADDYRGRVAAAIAEIADGRYEKVILSRKVPIGFAVDMPATYALGRARNTPARSFLFSLGGLAAAGFSPELVAAVSPSGVVATEPLAGTRAFGRGGELDRAAATELQADPKEIVEHAISVRECFREIESIAVPGSTAVSEFMVVRERGSVQHLASTVRGALADNAGPWRALAVLFPSITASGIPKSAALEAIYRLEPDSRGAYSGAVVTASSAGDLEATLALRTIFAADGEAWLRAGAGIVGQSTPEREFEETREKLASVAPYVVPVR
jgi:salicylate synthetase